MNIKIEKIVRTRRRTIALHMTDDAALIVRAPFKASDKTIMRIVQKHKEWIEQKKKEIEARKPKFIPREFVNGEGFLYLGNYYKLKIVDNQKEPLKFMDTFYLSREALPDAREVFTDWYKKMSREKITERVDWHAQKRNFKYNRVKINSAQKRWGSCSSNKNLNFSWRLIMAPMPVVDYVIIHELVHFEEKNHKKAFWDKVKILMPDYKEHQEWLKKNNYLLKF
jgi:predicted metal-dependent hydrolase